LNSRVKLNLKTFIKEPLIIHLNQLGRYCFPNSILMDINELAQMLYVFRHLQNSIFEHLKYTQCFIDLQKFKTSLISYELDSHKTHKFPIINFEKPDKSSHKDQKKTSETYSLLNLNSKLIQGKTPTCVFSICKWISNESTDLALHRLKLYGKNLIYRLLCNEKLENPMVFAIIRNLGMHINQELRQIAFATIRRDVRETLLTHLEHVGRISEQEKKDIEFLRRLESFLPNQSFSTAKQRSWFQALRKTQYKPIDKSCFFFEIKYLFFLIFIYIFFFKKEFCFFGKKSEILSFFLIKNPIFYRNFLMKKHW